MAARHGASKVALQTSRQRRLENVCDRPALTLLMARAKRGKAGGLDGLQDDLCAVAPEEMAEVFHPLLTKCALRVQEPLALNRSL